ncbi:MAG: hypothetical protein ACP5IE_09620, partial [Infirmifilum sp.]
EALALLLQSLDKAYLLHVFDSSIRDAERVAETAARLVRLTPLGYMVMMGRSEPTIRVEAKPNPLKKVDP